MKRFLPILALVLAACSTGGTSEAAPDAAVPDAQTAPHADTAPDAATAPDTDADAAPDTDTGTDTAAGVATAPTRLELWAPATADSGRFPVVVRAFVGADLAHFASGPVTLTAEGGRVSVPHPVFLYRGAGSATVVLAPDGGDVTVTARFGEVEAQRTVRAAASARQVGPGAVDRDTAWGPDETLVVAGDVRVAAGATLTIRSGTTVRLTGDVLVEGRLVVEGTAAAPVWLAPASESWGGVVVGREGASLTWALLTDGGADPARAFGHSGSQPVIFVEGGTLTLDHVALLDNPGKALGARDARVVVEDGVIARCDTGGELEFTHATIRRSHFLEMPNPDGVRIDDDNDGLYLRGAYPREGAPEPSRIAETVFAVGKDDGLDHNGAVVTVERSFFEGFHNEGIACSGGGSVQVEDTLVRGCDQGIEAGYGAPEVTVRRSVLTANGVGFRYGDSYDWEVTGTLSVVDSIAIDNPDGNVRNHVNALGGPREGAVSVRHSLVDDPAWDGRDGNVAGRPVFDATWRLAPGSPGTGAASDGGDIGIR